ncbi:hypothetical protein [Paraburkholderia sp. BL21I4N1]|uniref:hypothetical protein n=1 Tax=Paraburkholderia sp. BL21I4N1 TaxID=1938801 RepID=UPI000D43C9BD|nr:hypothetical protein [Paraburkholderia sp. BL21I4N1]PQV54639.1 hypothetical protein B0G83_101822 [Paraburkholderia sp. BL21I4N1]
MDERSPESTKYPDATAEWQGDGRDAQFRLSRMLYPYEYWSLPMQEERNCHAFNARVAEHDSRTTTRATANGMRAAVARLWLLLTRSISTR